MSKSFGSLLATAAFLFALLFTAAAFAQYGFLRWKLRDETQSDLRELAEETRDQIAFADNWNLLGYRRWTEGPDTYFVMAQNGTLIDTHGYLQSMFSRVSLPFRVEYDHPIKFSSDVGEDWTLYMHRLGDGVVILGVRKEIIPEGVDALFASNAARFGDNVEDALRTPERTIDEAFDYAIIDQNGIARWVIGGIPLKVSPPTIPANPTFLPTTAIEDKIYATFLEPLVSKSHSAVGIVSIFEDVTDEQHVLRESAVFNGILTAILWVITVAFSAAYLKRVRPSAISCAQIPFLDESETVEFKSSLQWDYTNKKMNKDLRRPVVKAIVGFLNSEKGGTLVIGMSDTKLLLGLEADYASFDSVKPDRDGFEQVLDGVLINAIGESLCARNVKPRFCPLQNKELCLVAVAPSNEPVFLEEKGVPTLFVRVGNSTRAFDVQEAIDYARDRWAGPSFRWPHAPRPAAI